MIKDRIYDPLALRILKKDDYEGIMGDLLNAYQRKNIYEKMKYSTKFSTFQKYFMKEYGKIFDSNNMDPDNDEDWKEVINNLLTSLHIYWNSLRYKNKMNKA